MNDGRDLDVLFENGVDHNDLQLLAEELRELATMATNIAKNVKAASSRLDDSGLPMRARMAVRGLTYIRSTVLRAQDLLKLATSGTLRETIRHRERGLAYAAKQKRRKAKS